jgi:hypothetical protein
VAKKIRKQPKKSYYGASDANSRANPSGRAGYGMRGAGRYMPPSKWLKKPKGRETGRVTKRSRIV